MPLHFIPALIAFTPQGQALRIMVNDGNGAVRSHD